MTPKLVKKEARIMIEHLNMDNDIYPQTDDWEDAMIEMVSEFNSPLSNYHRNVIINFIVENYNVDLSGNMLKIEIGEKRIDLLVEYPISRKYGAGFGKGDLLEMPASFFREKITEIILATPFGLKHFENIAEKSPYIFAV